MRKPALIFPFIFIFFLILTSFGGPCTYALGVEPLIINLNLMPGDSQEFSITLNSSGLPEIAQLNLYEPVQNLDGSMAYQKTDSTGLGFSGDWLELNETRVTVDPSQRSVVTGTVNVPFNARGSHTAVVMVEPETPETQKGITFKVRYAVYVNVNVESFGVREEAKVTELTLNNDEEDQPTLEFRLKNPSLLRYKASAETTIRDERNRLVERVEMRTPSAWQGNTTSTTIMPGAEVMFTGKPTKTLFPGKYNLRLFIQYGDSQLVQNQTIEIGEEDFAANNQQATYLSVEPEVVNVQVRSGGSSSKVVQISNNSPEVLEVKVTARDVEREYANSVFANAEIKLRSNPAFTLQPRSQERLVFTLKAPRDLAPGGYYGFLDIQAYSGDKLVDEHSVDLSLTNQGDVAYSAEILNIFGNSDKQEQLFSVNIKNLSNSHIVPEGTLTLKTKDGTVQQTIHLSLQEGVSRILPQKTGLLVATAKGLEPGQYIAAVKVRHNLAEIANAELPVEIVSTNP